MTGAAVRMSVSSGRSLGRRMRVAASWGAPILATAFAMLDGTVVYALGRLIAAVAPVH